MGCVRTAALARPSRFADDVRELLAAKRERRAQAAARERKRQEKAQKAFYEELRGATR